MNELSLFTGAGGGVLGTHHLLGWKTCGYVEWNEYCQRVIAARIADGYLTSAPIFTDVREFVQSGAAEQYRGVADVVTGGFPCQPFSHAARGRNVAQDLWPWMLRVISAVRPPYVLAENVAGSRGIWTGVRRDLETQGYRVCGPLRLGSSDVGGPDIGSRFWMVAEADENGQSMLPVNDEASGVQKPFGAGSWWRADPRSMGVADGLAYRMDRLAALGNGQVPAVAARAWWELAA